MKAKAGLDRAHKNVLTAKKGLFWGVFAGKRGVGMEQKAFYFALFRLLVLLCACKSLPVRIFQKMEVSQKNRAEKPTVGFLFFGSCGMIAP
jgi:hypothetical protein